jgi:hypothetical protein
VKPHAHAPILFALAAALTPGCQCGHLEIGPTNLVAMGRYQSLLGFPWGEDQRYVIAEKVDGIDRPLSEFTVFQVGERKTCDLVIRQPHWFWSLGNELFVFEKIDWNVWQGRLSHVVLPCGPVRPLFDNAYLASWRDPDGEFFYAFVDLDPETFRGRVVKVSWPTGHVAEVRQGVSDDWFRFDWPSQRFFFRDGGRIVVTKLDGAEEGTFGSGVTNFVSSGQSEILFEERPDGRPRLSRVRTDGTELVPLSQDACASGFADRRIVFAEPCNRPRMLVVLDRQTMQEKGRYGRAVTHFRTYPEGWLSWLDDATDFDLPGTLWVKPPDREPFKVAEGASPDWHVAPDPGHVLHAVVTGPGSARLAVYEIATGATRVLAANVDSTLVVAESPWSPHYAVVADLSAPGQPHEGSTPARVGNLSIVHPRTGESVVVAPAVPVYGFRFSWQVPAIGYLYDFDPMLRHGSFEVQSLLDRKRYPVDVKVKEFDEVYAPRRGVVYIVRTPERAGIYFVEADVALF